MGVYFLATYYVFWTVHKKLSIVAETIIIARVENLLILAMFLSFVIAFRFCSMQSWRVLAVSKELGCLPWIAPAEMLVICLIALLWLITGLSLCLQTFWPSSYQHMFSFILQLKIIIIFVLIPNFLTSTGPGKHQSQQNW